MKYVFSLIVAATTFFCSAQKNILSQNINPRAKELKHSLNASEDSLVLSCERSIIKVEIFNDDFERIYNVDENELIIPLNDLPLGRFLVEAKLIDKLIIMTLIRKGEINNTQTEKITMASSEPAPRTKLGIEASVVKNSGLKIASDIPTSANKTWVHHKIPKSYWVEYLISNGSSSRKTLRFASKEMVEKMITRNKLEIKTLHGKLNDLKIWEVYDTANFLRFKRVNPDFKQIEASEYFNVKPYYSSEYYLVSL